MVDMTKTNKFISSLLLLLSFCLASSALHADESFSLLDSLGGGQDDILDPDEAFQISHESLPGQFKVSWTIAEGHYLYRDKMQITTDESDVKTRPLVLPAGEEKDDPVFNKIKQ